MSGWIATPNTDIFTHCFGGSAWIVSDPDKLDGGPTLILDLDLADPKLASLKDEKLPRLPICSYINCDLWIEPQHFQIKPEIGEVVLVKRSSRYTTILEGDLSYPKPLSRQPVSLRLMTDMEMAVREEDHGRAVDSFVGGISFIRIGGPPLWLQGPVGRVCLCGEQQKYVCSIGYDYPNATGFLGDRPFFVGEAALYFFFCARCLILSVLSQST